MEDTNRKELWQPPIKLDKVTDDANASYIDSEKKH